MPDRLMSRLAWWLRYRLFLAACSIGMGLEDNETPEEDT